MKPSSLPEILASGLLESIYGDGALAQIPRYRAALNQFDEHYGAGPVHIFRAPGRVNLIGEHTDYNHGYVLPAALDRDVLLLARPRQDATVRLANTETQFEPVTFPLSRQIPPAATGHWSNYARGVAQTLCNQLGPVNEGGRLVGFDGLVSSAPPLGIPRGAGLSSSSALTVAVAVTLADLAGWQWTTSQMAHICSDGEWYVGTRGGIMDQLISLLGQQAHALFVDCRPAKDGTFRTRPIPLPSAYRLMVVESGVHHSNVGNAFNARVAACRAGVALLRHSHPAITHLRDVETIPWDALAETLPHTITLGQLAEQGIDLADLPNVAEDQPLRVQQCCRHVWHENRRVQAAVHALQQSDLHRVGELLLQAHASARDDYQISTPELDLLVNASTDVDGCVGARLTGAGWGGCVIALVHEAAESDFIQHVSARYAGETGRRPEIFPCRATAGAGKVMAIQM